MNESEMVDHLDRRYSETVGGNGPRYGTAAHVRNAAGFDARRTMDYFAMDLWPSKGLRRIGHEIKCSRGDWLRELKDPTKAQAFTPYMHDWYVVVSDASFVKREELPEGWGLMALQAGCLRVKVASMMPLPLPLPDTFVACLLRATKVHAYGAGHRAGYDTWARDHRWGDE